MTKMQSFAVALCAATAAAMSATAAQPMFSVTPYLQRPATNAMSVIWFAKDGAGEAAALSWWKSGGAVQRQPVAGTWAVALTNNVASGSDSAVHGNQFKYSYRITGLEPGTTYNYAVELPGGAAYTNAFRTAPDANGSVRFIYYNDSETQPGSTGAYETWEVTDSVIVSNTTTGATTQRTTRPTSVSKYPIDQTEGYATNIVRMVERNPDLFVIAGDLAAQGGKQQNWDEFWRHNAGEYNDPAGSIPILAAIGNHDLQDATPKPAGCNVNCEKPSGGEVAIEKYLSYFEVEPNGVDFSDVDSRDRSQMFHRVDYGPVTFLFLDTNNGDDYDVEKDTDIYLFRDASCPANKWGLPSSRCPDFNPGSRQYDWLTNNLADAQANSKFTFVVNHHCPYSVGYHNRTNVTESGEWLSGRAVRALTDTMLRYGVDGWLCGHDEIMEHSRISGTETLPDGTTRPTVLNIFDMGTAGDGLRGRQITKEANKYEVFRAQKDAPEIYDQNNILLDGGKHYGHMEVNVRETEPGVWTATLEPVYIFVNKDANGKAAGFERRVYDDVVVLTKSMRDGPGGYFPRTATPGQDGSAAHPYEIADADDLEALAEAVADCPDARGLCYVQTADIDMAGEAAFPGIGTYAASPSGGVPFTGTYDGQGHKIANIAMTIRIYGGVFNQVNGGTVRNLTVENLSAPAGVFGTCGYAIVGNAGNGATLRNLVATGSFCSTAQPGTHNMAGIVIRANGGATAATVTTVQNCTNNAAIYGTYTKLAGLCALTQAQSGFSAGKVVFDGCANNGALSMPSGATAGRDGLAGIVAYIDDDTELADCSNSGAMASALASAKIGQLVGWSFGRTLKDGGGNSGDAAGALVGDQSGGAITGFKYAVVSGGVVTTIPPPYTLAVGGEYLLEGDAAPVIELAEGESVAFNAALGYALTDAGVTAAKGLELSSVTAGPVVTYTAVRQTTNAFTISFAMSSAASRTFPSPWRPATQLK